MKIIRFLIVIVLALAATATQVSAQLKGDSDEEIRSHTANLPFEMPPITLPVIPDHRVSITEFGAVADGHTMNTKAINDAIAACAKKGGGTVVIPSGMWLTGPIMFESNIELHVDAGALVFFTPKFEEYPMPAKGGRVTSPISGRGLINIAITGSGMFNGNGQYWRPIKKEKMTERQWREQIASGGVVTPDGKMWWPSKEAMNGEEYLRNLRKETRRPTPEQVAGAREFLRPTMVDFTDCKNVLIDGPTFTNTPGWVLHPSNCENLIIRNTSVVNNWWGQNTDAADIGGCRNVLFYNNVLDVGDDGICMKAGINKEREFALENVVIADCIVYHAHGGFVIGSNTDGGMRNISVKNCTFIGTDIGLRFKSARDRGGAVQNIFVDGIRMKDIATAAILFDLFYDGNGDNDTAKERIPHFRDFDIKNIQCDGAKDALFVRGLADAPIERITLTNISIVADRAMTFEDARGFNISNFWLSFTSGPVMKVKDSRDIRIDGVTLANPAPLYVTASGSRTGGIVITNGDVTKVKKMTELDGEVPVEAVSVK